MKSLLAWLASQWAKNSPLRHAVGAFLAVELAPYVAQVYQWTKGVAVLPDWHLAVQPILASSSTHLEPLSTPKTPGLNLLVTLLCPNPTCGKRVAVMDGFPSQLRTIPRGGVTYVDGRTAWDPDKLVCRRCFNCFPAYKAKIPQYLQEAASGDLQKEHDRLLAASKVDQ